MAFEGLAQKLQDAFKKLTGRGKLTEKDVKEAMREVRMALLEADVNYVVVKDFVKRVSERAIGSDILESLSPGQHVIKIVNEELTELMGGSNAKLNLVSHPSVILLCGLQGAGKTTLAGKLAIQLKKQGKKPLLVACDIYRPAAIKQLQVVGEKADVPVFEAGQIDPVEIFQQAKAYAQHYFHDVIIVDTAGRLHIDADMMDEIERVKAAAKPDEILLVIDAMTGQDAVNVAQTFNDRLGVDGLVLSKLDSDTRGGAAISVKAVTGKPIKYASTGEKLTDLEPFHPERMASRILGMGDVLSLIEKAQQAVDEKSAREMEQKIRNQSFTLEDFLDQFKQMKKMGSITDILAMLPGIGNADKAMQMGMDDKQMARVEAIILSMTPQERRNPDMLQASRKKRIAAGSGTSVQQVNQLLKQFEQSRQLMKQISGMAKGKRRGMLPGMRR